MSDAPRCDGHETRPQSRIAPPSATNDWRFCPECWQVIHEHDLDPGVDFAAGELRSEVELDDV